MDSSSGLTKWFVWSCDHLPCTAGHYIVEQGGKEVERRKTGAHYIENGTTLCHIFWAILWVPLIVAAFASFMLVMFGLLHLAAHDDFMRGHPDSSAVVGLAAYFLPEAVAAGVVLAIASVFLALIGGSKVGFFALLWQYLKGIKQHICPLVRFGDAQRIS